MGDTSQASLNIVGGGHVGKVLARQFAAGGAFRIQDVCNRTLASAQDAVGFIGSGRAVATVAQMQPAGVTMLAVPDDQIVAGCAQLVQAGLLGPGSIVFHCSGALSSHDLAAARASGAVLASVHPVRSFADVAQVAAQFAGTFCSIEGDAPAVELLRTALERIGAQVIAIDASAKTLYHAASVFASNYLVSLMDVALRTYAAAGIPDDTARRLAQPLVTETVANVFRLGPAQALSGPIARGDWATVAKQQRAVDGWDPQAGALYELMAELTAELARRKAGLAGASA